MSSVTLEHHNSCVNYEIERAIILALLLTKGRTRYRLKSPPGGKGRVNSGNAIVEGAIPVAIMLKKPA